MKFVTKIFTILLIVYFSGCVKDPKHPGYEYMPDMARSRAYKPFTENPNFSDNSTMRNPVQGTIPRNFSPYSYPKTNEGYEKAGLIDTINPVPFSEKTLAEGKNLFQTYCVYCHGLQGKGDGIFVQKQKFPPPPSFSAVPLQNLPIGKMFYSITYGKNLMGSHANQLTQKERWKVVHYIQTLQKVN